MVNKYNRIPLLLDCISVSKDGVFNLTQGIPFADGQLECSAKDNICLIDENEKAYPTQGIVLATWSPDLRYVKWLLIDAQLPGYLSDGSSKLSLEYGPDVEPVLPDDPVSIENNENSLKISNNCLELIFRQDNPDFLAGAYVPTKRGWINLFRGLPGPYLYMRDSNGEYYNSRNALSPSIVIEDKGPVRTSVCIKGYHASKDSRRFCPYILRMHMYAGRSDLRIFHTFIFDQDPDHVELKSIGMMFPLDLGDNLRMTFGGEKEPHWAKVWNNSSFIQQSDREYEITLDNHNFGKGAKTKGWASLTGTMGSAAVALRDMWQEYPKGIALSSKGIDIQLWPENIEKTLCLKNPWKEPVIRAKYKEELLAKLKENPTAGVNFKGFLGTANVPPDSAEGNEQSMMEAKAFAEEYLQGRRVTYGDTSHTGSAIGLAKTHEFWVNFCSETLADNKLENWAFTVQKPAIAPAEPSYMCHTGALRILAPQDKKVFPEVEKGLELMFDRLYLEPVKLCRLYGMIDYGDLPNGHLRNDGVVYRLFRKEPNFKISDLIGWFNNEGMDMGYTLWQYFARTGERKYWQIAEANSEHVEDVDTIHFHPIYKNWVGRTHYHNMLHWSAGPSPSHTHVHGWLLHYFFTGNRRALEVAREAVDTDVRNQEPSGIYSNRHGVLRREFTSPIASLWAFYETTWEEKYGDCARRSLKFFLRTQNKSGQFPRDIFTSGKRGNRPRISKDESTGAGGMECYMLYDAYRITRDPAIKQAVVKLADWIIRTKFLTVNPLDGASGITAMSIPAAFVAHAYKLTGKKQYISALKEALTQFPEVACKFSKMKGRVCFRAPVAAHQFVSAALSAITKSSSNCE